jgi:hypothetical protein
MKPIPASKIQTARIHTFSPMKFTSLQRHLKFRRVHKKAPPQERFFTHSRGFVKLFPREHLSKDRWLHPGRSGRSRAIHPL